MGTIFVCKKLYQGRKVYLYYIYLVYMFWYFNLITNNNNQKLCIFKSKIKTRCKIFLFLFLIFRLSLSSSHFQRIKLIKLLFTKYKSRLIRFTMLMIHIQFIFDSCVNCSMNYYHSNVFAYIV